MTDVGVDLMIVRADVAPVGDLPDALADRPRLHSVRIIGPMADGAVDVIPADGAIPVTSRPARLVDAEEAARSLLDGPLRRLTGPILTVAVDQVSALTLWYAVRERPEVLAVNGLDAANRIVALIENGRSIESVLSVPEFSTERVLSDAGLTTDEGPSDWDLQIAPVGVELVDDRVVAGEWLSLSRSELVVNGDEVPEAERRAIEYSIAHTTPPALPADRRLVIGPANYAGQGRAWARSVNQHVEGVEAVNINIYPRGSKLLFDADMPITTTDWHRASERFGIARDYILPATHVLLEAARPILSVDAAQAPRGSSAESAARDLEAFVNAGKSVALLLHGSEIRDPALHGAIDAWSPFRDSANENFANMLGARVAATRSLLRDSDATRFVSTLDLVDFVPGAVWLPVVVDHRSFEHAPLALQNPVPVVAHAPTRSVLKGSEWIDPVLEALDHEGVIRYRRFRNLPAPAVPEMLRNVDVLVDQVVLGNPGVLAAQAMAAGRLVLAHLPESVRRRFPEPPPIVEVNPSSLERLIRELAATREAYRDVAESGREFARKYHDGRYSAAILARDFL